MDHCTIQVLYNLNFKLTGTYQMLWTKMVSFQRMKDELDDLGTHVTNKLPPIGRNACLAFIIVAVAFLFVLGFGVAYAVKTSSSDSTSSSLSSTSPTSSSLSASLSHPNYVFISNTSYSCPPLTGERLLTTMEKGQSFEGTISQIQISASQESSMIHTATPQSRPLVITIFTQVVRT